ncbi:MAG: hypothetical protein KGL19_08060, partial [Bacteroidota bacterium]|nr:hypothetical protein [Bacteroidota bacterium]
FRATQYNYNYAKNSIKNIDSSKQYSTYSTNVNMIIAITTCWAYSIFDGYTDTGGYIVSIGTQCSTDYVYVDSGSSMGNGGG